MFITKRISKNKIIFQSDNLLQKNFINFFLAPSDNFELEKDLREIFQGDIPRFYVLKQIHSERIVIPENEKIINFKTEGDSLITFQKNVLVGVKGADCYPVLFGDVKRRFVGAIHCGWRGLSKGIIENVFSFLIEKGFRPSDLFFLLGIGICEGCYEVGREVIREFEKRRYPETFYTFLEGRYYLNLKKIILMELLKWKVPEKNIEVLSLCSKCSYRFLPSYRRDKSEKRIFGFIGDFK